MGEKRERRRGRFCFPGVWDRIGPSRYCTTEGWDLANFHFFTRSQGTNRSEKITLRLDPSRPALIWSRAVVPSRRPLIQASRTFYWISRLVPAGPSGGYDGRYVCFDHRYQERPRRICGP